jgi:hypothetical protein
MNKKLFYFAWMLIVFISCKPTKKIDSAQNVFNRFVNPPAKYSTMPLWVWNDKMTQTQIDEQLTDFKSKGIYGVFVHPRPGLITPYLSDEWFEMFNFTVKKAKELGMYVWIYDENSYPSGFAGGFVPEAMPEAGGNGLIKIVTSRPDTIQNKLITLQETQNGFVQVDSAKPDNSITYQVYYLHPADRSSWHGGFSYVDIMQKKVTEKFLDLTFGAYKKNAGDEFGKTIPGAFTDEPNIFPFGSWKGAIAYTPDLFNAFKKKWGYRLETNLPSLYEDTGNWKKVRHDYYSVLLDLMVEGWAIPYSEYCAKNNLQLTGHYWDHDWPSPLGVPDNMALTAYSQLPGIDILMNNWNGGYSGQFGSNRIVKELRSVANQMGSERTLSETFGAAGWDISFADQKRIGDWQYALGVNFMNQHLSYVSIAGARKRDHPQSFSYHEPWWGGYKNMADYFSRLSVALSSGKQENRILVLEPTTTAWMYFSQAWQPRMDIPDDWKKGKMGNICEKFQGFVDSLEDAQVEYDLGCEDIMLKHGRVDGNKLEVGKCSYSLVILPPTLENLDSSTVKLLQDFLENGGKVLSYCGVPAFKDGQSDNALQLIASKWQKQWINGNLNKLSAEIEANCEPVIKFDDLNLHGYVFHHRRQLEDAQLVFIVNSSDSLQATGLFNINGGSVERWDPFTGSAEPFPFITMGEEISVDYTIAPGGSLLLCIKDEKKQSQLVKPTESSPVQPIGKMQIQRLSPNGLTIDFCDLNLKGKTDTNLYFYDAQTRIFRAHGFDKNPWDNGVQFKSQIMDRDTFGTGSGFEAIYHFQADAGVDLQSLKLVVERPSIFKVEVNGVDLQPETGQWWLERETGVFDLGKVAKIGKNSIKLKVNPMKVLAELEAIYILGNFSLEPVMPGFKLVKQKEIMPGSWASQGLPFYSDKIAYTSEFQVDDINSGYKVKLNSWKGVLAEVRVNDSLAGIIAFNPFELDITGKLKQGSNKISIVVCGSLRNTLGPHHYNGKLGSTWPHMFFYMDKGRTLAGNTYRFIDYGLNEGFELVKISGNK